METKLQTNPGLTSKREFHLIAITIVGIAGDYDGIWQGVNLTDSPYLFTDMPNFILHLLIVGQFLKPAATTGPEVTTGGIHAMRRWFDYLENIRLEVTFSASPDPRAHTITRYTAICHYHHSSRVGHATALISPILNRQIKLITALGNPGLVGAGFFPWNWIGRIHGR